MFRMCVHAPHGRLNTKPTQFGTPNSAAGRPLRNLGARYVENSGTFRGNPRSPETSDGSTRLRRNPPLIGAEPNRTKPPVEPPPTGGFDSPHQPRGSIGPGRGVAGPEHAGATRRAPRLPHPKPSAWSGPHPAL